MKVNRWQRWKEFNPFLLLLLDILFTFVRRHFGLWTRIFRWRFLSVVNFVCCFFFWFLFPPFIRLSSVWLVLLIAFPCIYWTFVCCWHMCVYESCDINLLVSPNQDRIESISIGNRGPKIFDDSFFARSPSWVFEALLWPLSASASAWHFLSSSSIYTRNRVFSGQAIGFCTRCLFYIDMLHRHFSMSMIWDSNKDKSKRTCCSVFIGHVLFFYFGFVQRNHDENESLNFTKIFDFNTIIYFFRCQKVNIPYLLRNNNKKKRTKSTKKENENYDDK